MNVVIIRTRSRESKSVKGARFFLVIINYMQFYRIPVGVMLFQCMPILILLIYGFHRKCIIQSTEYNTYSEDTVI